MKGRVAIERVDVLGILVLAARGIAHVTESMFSAEMGKLLNAEARKGVVAVSHCGVDEPKR